MDPPQRLDFKAPRLIVLVSESQQGSARARSGNTSSPSIDDLTNRLVLNSPRPVTPQPPTSAVGTKRTMTHLSPPYSPTKMRKTSALARAGSSGAVVPPPSNSENLLDPFVIAHCSRVQVLLDRKRLAWGTVFELARGVTHGAWCWDRVTEELLDKLCGKNAEAAARVHTVMTGRSSNITAAATELWCVDHT